MEKILVRPKGRNDRTGSADPAGILVFKSVSVIQSLKSLIYTFMIKQKVRKKLFTHVQLERDNVQKQLLRKNIVEKKEKCFCSNLKKQFLFLSF